MASSLDDLVGFTTAELLAAGDARSAEMQRVLDELDRRGGQDRAGGEAREQVQRWEQLTAGMPRG